MTGVTTDRPPLRIIFPRCCRLSHSADYQCVFSNNRKISDSNFLFLVRHSGNCVSRLGLAVAKKRLRRATDRNMVKRIIRESFRAQRHSLRGVDVVVLVQRGIDLRDKHLLRKGLDLLWRRVQRR